jgi:hypothetical protein
MEFETETRRHVSCHEVSLFVLHCLEQQLLNLSFFDSAIRFLVNEYKADPNTFLYDSSYGTSDKYSIMSKIYIDLGNYLSGKSDFIKIKLAL